MLFHFNLQSLVVSGLSLLRGINVLQSHSLFQSPCHQAQQPGLEFTLSGLALWCLMLKASLGLSWSFFRTPASHRLRSACSGMWHHARLQQWEFWRRPAQLKMRLVPTFGTAVLRGKAHTMKMENLDAVLRGQNLISMSWRCTGLWRC